jgi:LysM repeat protein
MRFLRSIAFGLGIAILATSVVLGSLSLAMLEGTLPDGSAGIPAPSETGTLPAMETPADKIPFSSEAPTFTATLPPTPSACPPPAGWVPITVQPNENLEILANRHFLKIDQIIQANCLTSETLVIGSLLYLPALPTDTLIPCGPPAGWITYTVQPKDNLYQISNLYQTSVPQLQAANCMGYSTLIKIGQRLYVPNVATITPTKTSTAIKTPTPPGSVILTLGISSSISEFSEAGITINLTYHLANTGSLSINGPFSVTDSKHTVTCPATSNLAAGASIDCSASHLTTQNELDAGSVNVTATGHAFYGGSEISSNQATASITAIQSSSLTLEKTSSTGSYVLPEDLINYTYNLKNSGNVTLSGPFSVSDNKTPVSCPSTTSLAPTASINCTAVYSVTQEDVDNGSVTNLATGEAFFKGIPVISNQDSLTIDATTPVGRLLNEYKVLVSLYSAGKDRISALFKFNT